MKPIIYLIPIFIDEFESLRDSGFIKVDRARIVISSTDSGSLTRPEVAFQMAAALPDFMPNAEHSVIIACFKDPICETDRLKSCEPLSAAKVCLMAKSCSGLIPLTQRSHEILRGRFGDEVELMEPVFEQLIEERFFQKEKFNKIQGGDALVEILIGEHDKYDLSRLKKIVTESHDKSDLVQKVIEYTRHAPAALEPISGLRDLRKILRDSLPDPKHLNPPLENLSAWGDPKWEIVTGFRKVYGDLELIEALDLIDGHWNLTVSAASLGIFLHWREHSYRIHGVDLKALESDCRELAGIMDGQIVLEAIWLLGYCSEFSSFAGSYYAALENPHPFGLNRVNITKAKLLRLERLQPPPTASPAADVTVADVEITKAGEQSVPASPDEAVKTLTGSSCPEVDHKSNQTESVVPESKSLESPEDSADSGTDDEESKPAVDGGIILTADTESDVAATPTPTDSSSIQGEFPIELSPKKTPSPKKPREPKKKTTAKKAAPRKVKKSDEKPDNDDEP